MKRSWNLEKVTWNTMKYVYLSIHIRNTIVTLSWTRTTWPTCAVRSTRGTAFFECKTLQHVFPQGSYYFRHQKRIKKELWKGIDSCFPNFPSCFLFSASFFRPKNCRFFTVAPAGQENSEGMGVDGNRTVSSKSQLGIFWVFWVSEIEILANYIIHQKSIPKNTYWNCSVVTPNCELVCL